jgi:hypothetical protein
MLKRSELAVLRRYANRYPLVEGERQEVVDVVMDTLRNAKSKRTRLAAAKTAMELDKVNLQEMGLYLQAKKMALDELKPAASPTVQVNINLSDPAQVAKLSDDELLRLHSQTLTLSGPSVRDGGDGPGDGAVQARPHPLG